jgi:CBS domain-containing protein
MPRVRSIMTRNPVTFSPETSIRDAMETLCAEHISGAPVLSGHRVAGVVSLTDLLSFLVVTRGSEQAPAVDTFSNTWEDRKELAEQEEFQELSEDDTPLDDWAEESESVVDTAEPDTRGLLDQHVVEEVMSTDIVSVASSAHVRVAAALMEQHRIHRVLVIDGGRLKGIVSSLDVARSLTGSHINTD